MVDALSFSVALSFKHFEDRWYKLAETSNKLQKIAGKQEHVLYV